MELILPHDFYSITKNKFLLLDTSVFIDTLLKPTQFGELFTYLKSTNECTLVTLDVVRLEFIKGAIDKQTFDKKELIIRDIIDSVLPISKDIWEKANSLLKLYKEDGKTASITDLLLAGTLAIYNKSLFLVTKNLSDFPGDIFKLETHFDLHHNKGLHSYGILSYKEPTNFPF